MRRKREREEDFYFEGFSSPNTTPVPDEFFDVLAPKLSEAELRVLLYIIRRTFGFKKQADAISLRQLVEGIKTKDGTVLDAGTGMSKRGVLLGVSGLVNKGIIEVRRRMSEDRKHEVNVYSLRFKDGDAGNPSADNSLRTREEGVPGVGYHGDQGSNRGIPPVGYHGDIQQTVLQETVLQTTTRPPRQDVVAHSQSSGEQNASAAKHSSGERAEREEELIQQLRDLGVHPKTAEKIAREGPEEAKELLRFVVWKLEHGWRPEVSAAAWIVAAIRDGYEVPEAFKEKCHAAEGEARRQEKADQELRRMQRELERERAVRLKALGVTEEDEKLWREVLERLKEQGQWRPVLAAAVLRRAAPGVYELVVPWRQMQSRARQCVDAISEIIAWILGEKAEVEVVTLNPER